jgi:DNA-binding response OmpR family regulator
VRVLLAEDDRRIAASLAGALRRAGFAVETVTDGEEAWFRGDTEDFDLVILDLGLPKLDGLTALKRWRKAGRSVPVLIVTARSNWDERVDGIEAGADDYVVKPFRVEEVVARVHAILRRSAGRASPLIEVGPLSLDTRTMT